MRIQNREQHTISARNGADLSAKTQAYLDGILQHLQREGKIVLSSEIIGPSMVHRHWENTLIIHWEAETDDPLYQRAHGRNGSISRRRFPALVISAVVLMALVTAMWFFKL